MTAGTAVPIAPVKLVDGARGGIVAVDGVAGVRDAELALVPCILTVVFLHQGVAIIALKIVGQHCQGTDGLFRQVVQPHRELLEAGLTLETKGDVLSVLLSTFDVEEDVEGW